MLTHDERIQSARSAVNYICSRTESELEQPVPNCPGWTVYNAAVHIGRVGVAWHAMILATPDDPESRTRGYADAEARGSGHSPETLGSWVDAALDALVDDPERACYFSMTGGHGTAGLWAWHAASELGIHRLDVESALGHAHDMSPERAIDAIEYTAEFFLPAMVRATQQELPAIELVGCGPDGEPSVTKRVGAGADAAAHVSGPLVDVVLAMWGRPHANLEVTGSGEAFEAWLELPGQAFQFGTWD